MKPPPQRNVDIACVLDAADFGKLKWLAEDPAGYDSVRTRAVELLEILQERKIEFVLAGGLAILQCQREG